MKNLFYLSIVALGLTLVSNVEFAQAQGYVGQSGMRSGRLLGSPFAFALGPSSPYAMGRIPTPPYFAIHPPVYYSQPVPRTYGYSPFAYPGSVMTPAVATATAQVIENPYVPTKAEQKFDRSVTQRRPVEILNPHVDKTTRMVSSDVH